MRKLWNWLRFPSRSQPVAVTPAKTRVVQVFSIGIYTGSSPWDLRPAPGAGNPVLRIQDLQEPRCTLVADPFMVRTDSEWHMFFELYSLKTYRGEIGLATSRDGLSWRYRQVVLAEPFHLSYPCVFRWEGDYYMVPESYQAGAVRLYKARRYPTEWEMVTSLIEGPNLSDATLLHHNSRWWMFVENSQMKHDTLRLFHADDLRGPWREHPGSPVICNNPRTARPGGRPVCVEGRWFRFAQDCETNYGVKVRMFEIEELTLSSYREREIAMSQELGPAGQGWNAGGMHHVDAHMIEPGKWLACVDGWYPETVPDTRNLG